MGGWETFLSFCHTFAKVNDSQPDSVLNLLQSLMSGNIPHYPSDTEHNIPLYWYHFLQFWNKDFGCMLRILNFLHHTDLQQVNWFVKIIVRRYWASQEFSRILKKGHAFLWITRIFSYNRKDFFFKCVNSYNSRNKPSSKMEVKDPAIL